MKEIQALQAIEPAFAPPQGQENAPCRILVVDQNSDLRLLYTDALTGPGCQVDVAENVATAWEALQTHRYHLLVTENDPPGLTGDELVRKLRCAGLELPVVMTATGWPMQVQAQNPSLPFAATLRKPFAVEALLDTVQYVLRTAARRKHLPRRNRRRNHGRPLPIEPATGSEPSFQDQAIDVR